MSELLILEKNSPIHYLNLEEKSTIPSSHQDLPHEVSERLIEGDTPLRAWRKHRGYSKIELSEAAEVKYTQIVGIENCESVGSDDAIRRMAKVLDVDFFQLCEREDRAVVCSNRPVS